MKYIVSLCALASTVVLTSCRQQSDEVLYSFVVIGCNRMDKADVDLAKNPSTANIAQLDRTLEEITQITPKPDYLFFAGDMIYGYEPDTIKLKGMLTAWRQHWETSIASKSGIQLVPICGNHETQDTSRIAFEAAERQWLNVMQPYIRNSNGPHAGSADSLGSDQSRLTYSFDHRDAHFVVLNTDPVGMDAHVPAHWIAGDLVNARKIGAKHIFAIGHKPAFAFDGGTGGLVPGNRGEFWTALEENHAEAMLSAHNHVYRRFQPRHEKTWMVIAGNGGSLLEPGLTDKEQFFGYTVVSVTKSGRVIVRSYGRDIPKEGYAAAAPSSRYPTTLRDSADISWKD